MSSYKVILEVSRLLRQTLWDSFSTDNAVHPLHVPNLESIVLTNPADAARQQNRRLSIWLYSVQENEHLHNALPTRRPDNDALVQYPPLAINLFYLVTPSTTSVEGDQLVLGKTMQIFHDNATLLLFSAEDPGHNEELRVSMVQRDLRELAEVWEALQQPYRLSVCYEVRVPRIDSLRIERAGRVSERVVRFRDNPQPVGALG
jgi:hypothetical protein